MSLAEGTQAQIAYKKYAAGTMTANAEAVSTSDLGQSGAQVIRRVSSSLDLKKATYKSAEIRTDRQIADFRHGARKVEGSISGELSPKTYGDFIEASTRGTWTAAIVLSQVGLTSAAFDNTLSKVTFAGGDPVALGLRVGDLLRFTGLTTGSANNNINFIITAFSAASNRTVTVFPKPTTSAADSTFSVTGTKFVFPPLAAASQISRKFGISIYHPDISLDRLHTECRAGGFMLKAPATGMLTCEFPFTGRDLETYTGATSPVAPFFTTPTAATTTGVFASVNGLLRVGGSTIGVVTALDLTVALTRTADAVVGQNFPPEVFLGREDVSGQMAALLQDGVLLGDFINETEVDLLVYFTTTSAVNSPAMTIHLPRIKFGGGTVQTQGEAGTPITLPFQALLSTATVASTGIEQTTMRVCDTEM